MAFNETCFTTPIGTHIESLINQVYTERHCVIASSTKNLFEKFNVMNSHTGKHLQISFENKRQHAACKYRVSEV